MVRPSVGKDADGVSVIRPQSQALIVGIDVHLVETLQEFPQVSWGWRVWTSFRHAPIMAANWDFVSLTKRRQNYTKGINS
ncbi:hypothetical protein PS9374_04606 [Planomonospora sphaerica]|uniref:Uncharacterized protein n=1 Tax=Planomonospora sphaerica TaxID=161355 RepID=A0A171DJC6_9ACTN|nr:hypothetical protein PS9374_04606 [Planomonospora sphaerica]